MKDFRGLNVWEKAHKLTLKIYQATSTFPREEIYGLTSQMRRAFLLTCELKFINSLNYSKLTSEVIDSKRMLASFIKKL
jgi:hypothetical protein